MHTPDVSGPAFATNLDAVQDASGCQLSEDVAFGARGSALFPDLPAWARAGRTRDGTWRAPPLAIGMGAEWRDRSHLLVLTPVGAAAAQGAGPLYIQVAVKPGRLVAGR